MLIDHLDFTFSEFASLSFCPSFCGLVSLSLIGLQGLLCILDSHSPFAADIFGLSVACLFTWFIVSRAEWKLFFFGFLFF